MNRCYAVTIAETLLVSVFRSRVQVAGLKRGSHGLGKDESRVKLDACLWYRVDGPYRIRLPSTAPLWRPHLLRSSTMLKIHVAVDSQGLPEQL
jgi:hypothetical protein